MGGKVTFPMTSALIALLLMLSQQPSPQKGDVEGIAARPDTGAAIPNVKIVLRAGSRAGQTFSAQTDNNGRFRILDIPSGTYALEAVLDGYLAVQSPRMNPNWGATVTVKTDRLVPVGPLLFVPGATVSGRVVNSDGTPETRGIVELLQPGYNAAGVREWLPVERGGQDQTTTDSSGNFRMSLFGPGKYYLRVSRRDIRTGNSTAWAPAVYFPGVLDATAATEIRLQPGQNFVAEVKLPASGAHKVSGQVASALPNGTAGSPIQITLKRRGSGVPLEQSRATSGVLTLPDDGDGKFEFSGIPAGPYELTAFSGRRDIGRGMSDPNPTFVARASFEVRDTDIANLSLTLRPGVEVKGKLTIVGNPAGFQLLRAGTEGGGRTGGTDVSLSLLSNDSSPSGSPMPPTITGTNFTLPNVHPGDYSLAVSLVGAQRAAYVADIRSGSQSIFGESVTIGSETPAPLEVVINTNGATLPISISEMAGNPVVVALVPKPPNSNNPLRYRITNADSSGRVNINAVAPGEYTLYAWEYVGIPPASVMDPAFLAAYGKRGVPVRVEKTPAAPVDVPAVQLAPLCCQ
jgi:hypothetical protein